MSTKEDESRLIRVVLPVGDINVLIRHWSKEGDALAVKVLQDCRKVHGLEPLEIEVKKSGKPKAVVTNGQPEG